MKNLIWQFIKTRTAAVFSKFSFKDATKKVEEKVIVEVEHILPEAEQTVMQKIEGETDKVLNNTSSNTGEKSKWQSWFPFTLFYGNGEFQPVYLWIFIFCSLSVFMVYVKVHAAAIAVSKGTFTSDMVSTGDLGVVLGFISSLILLYNNDKQKSKQNKPEDN